MKYIMIEQKISGEVYRYTPVIFPDTLSHVDVAKAIEPLIKNGRTVSAGDIQMSLDNVECSGNSITLQMDANPDRDSMVISAYDVMHGLVY